MSSAIQSPSHRAGIEIPHTLFFCGIGFAGDLFNFVAVLGEIFLANSVLHATEWELGVLGTASALGYTLPCIGTGLLSERLGRRPMCLTAMAGMALTYLAAPHAPTIWILCGISFMRSVFTGFLWPPIMAWMTETSSSDALSRFLGKYNMSWAVGMLCGFYLAGWGFEHRSPATPFYMAAGFAAASFLFLLVCSPRLAPVEPPVHDVPAHHVRFFMRQGMVLNMVSNFLIALVLYMMPKVVGNTMGEEDLSLLQVARMTGQTAAFGIMGHRIDWHFRQMPAWICALCFVAGLLLVGVAHSFVVYAVGCTFLGIAFGMGFSMCAYYTLALSQSKGLGSGIMETLVGAGALLGPLYGGVIASYTSARGAIFAGVVILAIALPLISSLSLSRQANGDA